MKEQVALLCEMVSKLQVDFHEAEDKKRAEKKVALHEAKVAHQEAKVELARARREQDSENPALQEALHEAKEALHEAKVAHQEAKVELARARREQDSENSVLQEALHEAKEALHDAKAQRDRAYEDAKAQREDAKAQRDRAYEDAKAQREDAKAQRGRAREDSIDSTLRTLKTLIENLPQTLESILLRTPHIQERPSGSPTYATLGKSVRNALKTYTEVQGDGAPIVPSSELGEIVAARNEATLTALLTPYLYDVVAQSNPNAILVNSEVYPWLEGLKPDFFVTYHNLFTDRVPPTQEEEPNVTEKRTTFPDRFKYGAMPPEILDCVSILFEAKKKLDLHTHLGQLVSYYQFLQPHNPGKIAFIEGQHCRLDAAGSRAALVGWLSGVDLPGPVRTLDEVAKLQGVQVRGFLGKSTARVYKCQKNGRDYALKVAREQDFSYTMELGALNRIEHENIRAVKLVSESVQYCRDGTPSYLLEPVGDPTQKIGAVALVKSLHELHKQGIAHGDARPPNAILVNREVYWTDFRYAQKDNWGVIQFDVATLFPFLGISREALMPGSPLMKDITKYAQAPADTDLVALWRRGVTLYSQITPL
eukprot:TRINITY_DN419_c0_g1_i2.p1 TRINITY_DN419_c0_g1~~TRINITY_DN419_c0_g1_i2.p1  ORF type:complete len:624 (-),score=111.10 TRINITY_DN419_c0_g1_i2:793-2574(-)